MWFLSLKGQVLISTLLNLFFSDTVTRSGIIFCAMATVIDRLRQRE